MIVRVFRSNIAVLRVLPLRKLSTCFKRSRVQFLQEWMMSEFGNLASSHSTGSWFSLAGWLQKVLLKSRPISFLGSKSFYLSVPSLPTGRQGISGVKHHYSPRFSRCSESAWHFVPLSCCYHCFLGGELTSGGNWITHIAHLIRLLVILRLLEEAQ